METAVTGAGLHISSATVRYAAFTALRQVSITVAPGTRHAIIGLNGAGKTTLLDTVAGTRTPTTGRILLDGRDITGLPPHRRARLGIARTWQHPTVCEHLTVLDNLLLAHPRRQYRADRRRDALHTLETVGLAALADTPAHRLSYGQRRHLELAIALAAQPRLLLLDEPSAGLTAAETRQVIARLAALGSQVTVMLVEHNRDLIDAVADTVTVLDHGAVTATGPANATVAGARTRRRDLRGTPPAAATAHQFGAPILAVRGLRAGYGPMDVLHDVNLSLYRGEILAVTGANGAGKTTLLHAIAGVHPTRAPTRILLDGREITTLDTAHRARLGVALLPQDRRVFARLTVAANLRIPHRPATRRRWSQQDVLDLLPGLRDRLRQKAGTLSGGERLILALAQALLNGPRVLLLDEPFAGLASQALQPVYGCLAHAAAAGTATLLIDHRTPEALAHRAVDIHGGTLHPGHHADV